MNDEVIREFILETHENLAQLDADLLTLEKQPTEKQTLARVFRTLHSVKGTAGFIGLTKLQAVAHAAENLLSKLRAGELTFNRPIATTLLKVVDAIRQMMQSLEENNTEGQGDYTALLSKLEQLREGTPTTEHSESSTSKNSNSATAISVSSISGVLPSSQMESSGAALVDSTLRVDVVLLDKLMNLVGELVLARNQIVQFASTNFSAAQDDSGFLNTASRLNTLTTELQTSVMKTRMQPISTVWSKFPRIVRDLSLACGKQVHLEMEGQDTELDKTLIEAIRDPLTHMVRNAVDHGIELPATRTEHGKAPEGRLLLQASHESGKVVIEIVDDGGGIDPQKVRAKAIQQRLISSIDASRMTEREIINLVFLPGFSTAEKVTQLSGRGVGMDVVRTNIERIGGTVDLESRLGQGTTVRIKIPLTLAIIPALSVSCGRERFCIPQVNLLELVRMESSQTNTSIEHIQGAPVYRLREKLLPIVYLDQELRIAPVGPRPASEETLIVVLHAEDHDFGLVVDAIHDTQEIVVKPLQQQLKGLNIYSGVTILGDGSVALILDVLGLAQQAKVLGPKLERGRAQVVNLEENRSPRQRVSVLLFGTPNGSRMAIPLDEVARLEEFPRQMVERLGQREVVQYRGEILPIVHLADFFGESQANTDVNLSATVQVVVHIRNGRSIGLAIGRILDVVDQPLDYIGASTRPGVRFTAVVQGKVAEFVDVDAVWQQAHPTAVSMEAPA